ncbi:MAG: hypothetical protein GY798_11670 [Hyphomicrobiales bacterium]|nr:hypothetical protein [Hyphomicrobiales bacterium]
MIRTDDAVLPALVVLAGATLWTVVWAIAPGGSAATAASVFVAAAALSALLAALSWAILRRPGAGPLPYLLATGATAGVSGLVSLVVLADVVPLDPTALGCVYVLSFVVLTTALARPSPGALREIGIAAACWAPLVILFWVDRVDVGIDQLVWAEGDQRMYLRTANALVRGEYLETPYLLGLPTLLAPFSLAVDAVDDATVEHANLVNRVLLPPFIGIVMPVIIALTARAISISVGMGRRVGATFVGATTTVLVLAAYVWSAPAFVTARSAELVPRRILGLVFAPETISLGLAACLVLLVARTGSQRKATWNIWIVGLGCAFGVMVREYNAVLVLIAFVALATVPGGALRTFKTGAVAILGFLPQFLYWFFVYDSLFFPNRLVLWANGARPEHWRPAVLERYGWDTERPPQVSTEYISTNLADWWNSYSWVLLGCAVLAVTLVALRPAQWRLWSVCTVAIWATVLYNSAYINIVVTWRYNQILMPFVATLMGATLLAIASTARSRRGSRGSRGRLAVAEATAPTAVSPR